MMKNMRFSILIVLLAAINATIAAEEPTLKFRSDGSFKIAQFTDLHLRTFNQGEVTAVYSFMDEVIRTEKPDLLVITGDVVTVKPAAPEWTRLVKFLDDKKTPWCIVFGNHDAQQDLSRSEMSSIIFSGKYSLNIPNEDGELADIQVPVLSSDGVASFYLFFMDSHDYSTALGMETYGWFTWEQVNWLRQCCLERTGTDGTVAPSIAFFHIPLCEYIDAWSVRDNPRQGIASSSQSIGIRGENIACGGLNSGMFAAMRETKSVIGTSVGHDHDNDFIATYKGIALCYGRFSGSNTVYNHLPQGSRIFRIHEKEKGFETWIHEAGGRIVRHVKFDDGKLEEAPRKDRSRPFGSWEEFPVR